MKKLLLIVLALTVVSFSAFAEEPTIDEATRLKELTEATETTLSICPKTRLITGCMSCHVEPDWTLKEKQPNVNRTFPSGPDMKITNDGKVAHLLITSISSREVANFFEYVRWHPEIKKSIFEIYSPGGSLFEAWRIVGLMELWKSMGMVIETRVHGWAASAGFILFVNGTPGHRFASETAELMWHELYSFSFFKVTRPSDAEDESIVLRHLQTTASDYLAKRSKLSAKEWDAKVFKKEFWCNGTEAIEFGLSDGFPGKR